MGIGQLCKKLEGRPGNAGLCGHDLLADEIGHEEKVGQDHNTCPIQFHCVKLEVTLTFGEIFRKDCSPFSVIEEQLVICRVFRRGMSVKFIRAASVIAVLARSSTSKDSIALI